MEAGIQLLLQGGALGLLGYLIWWTTREGAPKLFTHLSGIATSMQTVAGRLEALEDEVKTLRTEVEELRACKED